MKGRHAVHLGIEQNVYEHLDLGELLPKQRRHGCVGHCPGEFVEAQLKSVRQFDVVKARSVSRRDGCLAQARLKFIRRKRRGRGNLALELSLEFIEGRAVSLEVTLQFPIVRVIWERIETSKSVPLCNHFREPSPCIVPGTPSPIKQCTGE